uniref:LRAT domain-containing protein n=1 Tax=Mycena chlorophos TaxID=658473 RepID=A0ABQ0L2Z6_MYCCL|nr:predicted protein [Mycena chlorophos]
MNASCFSFDVCARGLAELPGSPPVVAVGDFIPLSRRGFRPRPAVRPLDFPQPTPCRVLRTLRRWSRLWSFGFREQVGRVAANDAGSLLREHDAWATGHGRIGPRGQFSVLENGSRVDTLRMSAILRFPIVTNTTHSYEYCQPLPPCFLAPSPSYMHLSLWPLTLYICLRSARTYIRVIPPLSSQIISVSCVALFKFPYWRVPSPAACGFSASRSHGRFIHRPGVLGVAASGTTSIRLGLLLIRTATTDQTPQPTPLHAGNGVMPTDSEPQFERTPGSFREVCICLSKLGSSSAASSSESTRRFTHSSVPRAERIQAKPTAKPGIVFPSLLHWALVVDGLIYELLKDEENNNTIVLNRRKYDPKVDAEYWVASVGKTDFTDDGLVAVGEWALSKMKRKYNFAKNNCQHFIELVVHVVCGGAVQWPDGLRAFEVKRAMVRTFHATCCGSWTALASTAVVANPVMGLVFVAVGTVFTIASVISD